MSRRACFRAITWKLHYHFWVSNLPFRNLEIYCNLESLGGINFKSINFKLILFFSQSQRNGSYSSTLPKFKFSHGSILRRVIFNGRSLEKLNIHKKFSKKFFLTSIIVKHGILMLVQLKKLKKIIISKLYIGMSNMEFHLFPIEIMSTAANWKVNYDSYCMKDRLVWIISNSSQGVLGWQIICHILDCNTCLGNVHMD